LNSFQQIGRAIDAEVKRQTEIYDENGTIDQETRGWDDDAGESHSLRSKEDAMDYRYFPEPDLPPLVITQEYIDERKIAELPIDRRQKYLNEWKLLPDDARILSSERAMSDFFEKTVALTNEPKKSASLILTVILGILKKGDEEIDFSTLKITPEALAKVVNMLKMMKFLLQMHRKWSNYSSMKVVIQMTIVDEKWLRQVNDTGAMEAIVDALSLLLMLHKSRNTSLGK
jgi:aspartyl-tRNA(Asn)/glutamyl-tRNA(Gln) amidotransferase subunit B